MRSVAHQSHILEEKGRERRSQRREHRLIIKMKIKHNIYNIKLLMPTTERSRQKKETLTCNGCYQAKQEANQNNIEYILDSFF